MLVTSRTDTDLLESLLRNDLGQDNQSSTSISPVSLGLSNEDLEPAGDDLHGGDGDASDLDLPNMDDGALPKRESGHDASSTNFGRTANNSSRGCHISPKILLS